MEKVKEWLRVDAGSGSGSGSGSGDGIKSVNGENVWMVDNVQTLIDKVKNNVAKGRILMGDLTTKPCYIVKGNNLFANNLRTQNFT